MILRRLGEAISEQNWFTVVIEVLVVVVGIFIGLQVDGWNEARKDRKDEDIFLQRLHSDLMLAETLSNRVRDRRLNRLQSTMAASDVLFGRNDQGTLTEEECTAIASITYFNINVSGITSLEELIGTGRMDIIRDSDLRTALVELQQTRTALAFMIKLQTSSSGFTNLPIAHPDLIKVTSYFNPEIGEIMSRHLCDLDGMRANQLFLNQFSANLDGYDAYVRDGLAPWSLKFDEVHLLVDQAIGFSHLPDEKDGP